jgi:hypothetical protein
MILADNDQINYLFREGFGGFSKLYTDAEDITGSFEESFFLESKMTIENTN